MTTYAEVINGSCGWHMEYTLDTETGVLKIEGSGDTFTDSWSSYISFIKTVDICDGVKGIPTEVFYGCINLTSVSIPESVTYIRDEAFCGCRELVKVNLPNSVDHIGYGAFSGCTKLTTFNVPNSLSYLGENAFSGTQWYNDQSDGLVYVGNVVYNYKGTMEEGTSVCIKDGTTAIAEGAFRNCSQLTSVVIPNSVTKIQQDAFWGCSGLTSVVIPNGVQRIEIDAFYGCTRLTSLVLPNSLLYIGENAFRNCYSLASVTIPYSVTDIKDRAFYGCSQHLTLTWNSNRGIYRTKFDNLENLILGDSVTTFYAEPGVLDIKSLTIGKNVQLISDGAFRYCRNLTELISIATTPPKCYSNTFPFYGTLLVPPGCADAYQKAEYWENFDIMEFAVDKCDTPKIAFQNGRIVFSCSTEGAEVNYTISKPSLEYTGQGDVNIMELNSNTYTVKAWASREGYVDSDFVEMTITIGNGDVNCDGSVTVEDIPILVQKVLGHSGY